MGLEVLLYLECPCNCGRVVKIDVMPEPGAEEFVRDIEKVGNKIWQTLVNEKGLEGAIQFLHECD